MPTLDALIGYTGFVGENLRTQRHFDLLYNSGNILEIRGGKFDLVVCAAAPGTKWIANQNPQADLKNIQKLIENLSFITCRKFVLISTIDVYPQPLLGYDENYQIDGNRLTAYGYHRYLLEKYVGQNFNSLLVRLPGVFGNNLKKNVIYDLMRYKKTSANPESLMQFYWLGRLWADIKKSLDKGLASLNVASEPFLLKNLAGQIFNIELPPNQAPPANYDMRTIHAALWNKKSHYLYGHQETLQDMETFIAQA